MKLVILAAGLGSRLMPLTADKPKCMVEVSGTPILGWQLDVAQKLKINKTALVVGYKPEAIPYENLIRYVNEEYDTTNMVESFFCAREFFDEDLIVSYGDIIYEEEVLNRLILTEGNAIVSDQEWHSYWSKRIENPLEDAETFKSENGYVIELGKKPKSNDEVMGQYIGLFKLTKETLNKFINKYDELREGDNRQIKNLYMTDFLQMLIDSGEEFRELKISRSWVEIDSVTDKEVAESLIQKSANSFSIN